MKHVNHRFAHALVWTLIAVAGAAVGTRIVWVHAFHGAFVPLSVAVNSDTDAATMLTRAGLDPRALAAAGVGVPSVAGVVEAAMEEASSRAASLAAADEAARGARQSVDRLARIVQSGTASQEQIAQLSSARSMLAAAHANQHAALDAVFAAGAAQMGEAQRRIANRTVPDQAGFTGAVLNAGEFAVVVRALESINKGNSISNPKLLVTNNQRAVFSSTLQQPITQQTRTGSNDTTFSYGGSESAGTTISVQPQIAQGDHLALTYSIKLSNFVGTSTTAGLPPPKQENSVDSSATIPDGYTVVVGGMELITDSEAVAQVPILGSIPIIGELFKSRDTGNGRTRFYVFIRANVLRSGMLEDLKYLSAQDLRKVGELGVKVSDGFPEVRARVIR
ncbi:MAG: hypothetical protein GIKADHBN_02331 [Phycisphaerales bacterium]|nr:hypothetical protein [Phycisphaerales bacterium]